MGIVDEIKKILGVEKDEEVSAKDMETWKSLQSPRSLPKPGPDELSCKHCGGIIPKNADYCPYCGFNIHNITGWTCPSCGASNTANSTTCRYCGNKNKGPVPIKTPEFLKQGGRISQPKKSQSGLSALGGIFGGIARGISEKSGAMPEEEVKELKEVKKAHDFQDWLGNPLAGIAGKQTKVDKLAAVAGKAAGAVGGVKKVGRSDRTNVTCRYCGTSYPYEEDHCPNPECSYFLQNGEPAPNPHQDPFRKKMLEKDKTSLKSSAGKKVGARIYEVFIFEIAGIASLLIPTFLAFPYSFAYLAIALMVFMPAYILFPSEHDILRSIGPDENMGEGKAALLFPKAGAKIFAFAFILFQFSMINMLVTLVLAFIFYFSLPLRYRTSRPYEMIESWTRMGLGLYIAILFLMVFGTTTSVGSSLAFMAAAFFFTLPVHSEEKEEGAFVVVVSDKIKRVLDSPVERYVIFPILMIAALITSGIMLGWTGSIAQIMFIAVWFLSFITGISAGPEGRPAIGILMIFIALFAFTSMYTGVIGQAVFGYWWPQISSFGETFLSPLNSVWAQAQSSMSDAWEMMTCPQCYYQKKLLVDQATKSVIMTGGTPMSIEISKFELVPSMIGTLEPSEPTIGDMELNNQGDFTSGNILLELWTSRVDAVNLIDIKEGEVTNLRCSSNPKYSDSTSLGGTAYCNWEDTKTYPKETRVATFKLEGGSPWGDTYSNCTSNGNVSCTCFAAGCLVNTIYSHSGQAVKVNANLTYDYVVNVSMPVTIINNETYLKKLQANEMVLQDLTSEYTGGPIKATLYTQKQPARTDVPFLVVASIYNDGSGELLNITDFTITVYKGDNVVDHVEFLGTTFRNNQPTTTDPLPNGCGSDPIGPIGPTFNTSTGNFVLNCSNEWGTLKQGEFKRISFYIYPNTSIDDEKTTQIVGWAQYRYRKTTSQTLTIANAPPQ